MILWFTLVSPVDTRIIKMFILKKNQNLFFSLSVDTSAERLKGFILSLWDQDAFKSTLLFISVYVSYFT